jgi:hypothetical protein
MEVKVKKTFIQKITFDSALENIESKVRSVNKEKKFNEMVERLGEEKIKKITSH